jgi:hypothetical protein
MTTTAAERAAFGRRWERVTEWPLTIAAIVFLAAYAIPILNPDLPTWLLDLCRSLSWITWGIFAVDIASGCSWPISGCSIWSGTGTTFSCSPYPCSDRCACSA